MHQGPVLRAAFSQGLEGPRAAWVRSTDSPAKPGRPPQGEGAGLPIFNGKLGQTRRLFFSIFAHQVILYGHDRY